MLHAFCSPDFYNKWVHLPKDTDPVHPFISDNPKLFPYFQNTCGAMDGSQLDVNPSEEDRDACRNRKGRLTQNVLACCSFDLLFQYVLSGWEGSAADAHVYQSARTSSLPAIPGKYYLGDAGFGSCDAILIPYRETRYHLREWQLGNSGCVSSYSLGRH